jgi:excisionase family DNA binding protein
MHESRLSKADEVSAKEAAEIAGLSTRTVRRWIADGRLPAKKWGRSFRISLTDLSAVTGRPLVSADTKTVPESPAEAQVRANQPADDGDEVTGLVHNLMAELLQATATAARWRTLVEVLILQLEQTEQRLAAIEDRRDESNHLGRAGASGRLSVESWRDLIRSVREPSADALSLDVRRQRPPSNKHSAS